MAVTAPSWNERANGIAVLSKYMELLHVIQQTRKGYQGFLFSNENRSNGSASMEVAGVSSRNRTALKQREQQQRSSIITLRSAVLNELVSSALRWLLGVNTTALVAESTTEAPLRGMSVVIESALEALQGIIEDVQVLIADEVAGDVVWSNLTVHSGTRGSRHISSSLGDGVLVIAPGVISVNETAAGAAGAAGARLTVLESVNATSTNSLQTLSSLLQLARESTAATKRVYATINATVNVGVNVGDASPPSTPSPSGPPCISVSDAARVVAVVASLVSSSLRAGYSKTISTPSLTLSTHRLWLTANDIRSLKYHEKLGDEKLGDEKLGDEKLGDEKLGDAPAGVGRDAEKEKPPLLQVLTLPPTALLLREVAVAPAQTTTRVASLTSSGLTAVTAAPQCVQVRERVQTWLSNLSYPWVNWTAAAASRERALATADAGREEGHELHHGGGTNRSSSENNTAVVNWHAGWSRGTDGRWLSPPSRSSLLGAWTGKGGWTERVASQEAVAVEVYVVWWRGSLWPSGGGGEHLVRIRRSSGNSNSTGNTMNVSLTRSAILGSDVVSVQLRVRRSSSYASSSYTHHFHRSCVF
jgi:hypothetical protein